MQKLTKIVATIGPATESEEMLTQLIAAGMNIARFNTKHSEPAWHTERIARVKHVAQAQNTNLGVLLDLQGPEIRVETSHQKAIALTEGAEILFSSERNEADKPYVIVPQLVIEALQVGDTLLLDDGACELVVDSVLGTQVKAHATSPAAIGHRKTLNTPGIVLDVPSLTQRDYAYLDGVDLSLVDFVGLSFVRHKEDIAVLRQELSARKSEAAIVAKIENQAALDHLEEIIDASDAVMIARGDLGVEVAYQDLIFLQRTIIEACRRHSKPVITATHMLKSMVEHPRPTRAEVSDVTHAIFDRTDAIMLSEETTIGAYPLQAVRVQASIAQVNEPRLESESLTQFSPSHSTTEAICYAAAQLLSSQTDAIAAILCLTESGETARELSRFHLRLPVIAATHNHKTLNELTLLYGVEPYLIHPKTESTFSEAGVSQLTAELIEKNILKRQQKILVIHGYRWGVSGTTNGLSIISL